MAKDSNRKVYSEQDNVDIYSSIGKKKKKNQCGNILDFR